MNNYICNLQPSPLDSRDIMLESVYPDNVQLPEILDLRNQLTPIRDQGSQGTCSAQTAACIKEWQENVNIHFNNYMSPQFIYNLRNNHDSSGMNPHDTMEILYKIGIVPEYDYPYNSMSSISNELKNQAKRYKIQGYAKVNTIESLKKALFANGPCYIAFPVYNTDKMDFWNPDYKGQNMIGGHATTVVGYNKNSFIIRNSWSSNWGDKGYTYFPFNQWGMHWECWTSIDEDSNQNNITHKVESNLTEKRNLFRKIFNFKLKRR
ncbi:C1 family peptidase [bacterium]|jgi:C1A family cysteine protease|nr:C1 family peptidase [bacterium]